MTQRLRRHATENIIFYDLWQDILADSLRNGDFKNTITQDLAAANISLAQVKNFCWMFDFKPEGISADDIVEVYQWFIKLGIAPEQFRVAFSCVENVNQLPYPAICLPDRLIYNGNWWTHLDRCQTDWHALPMTHQAVCLMRRPSVSRGMLAKRLLSKFSMADLIMTFGTNGSDTSPDIKRLIAPHSYPMIVDCPIADHVAQHRIDHDWFYRAPVNLIAESSSQTDPNTWRSIFITEKTFKALAWHQFPIWYAVPGLVQAVRNLGFDVFDDLLDNHSYDTVEDPWIRMTQVVMLTRRFCDANTKSLRKQHWQRLVRNAEIIREIHTTAISRHTQMLEQLINEPIAI